MGRTSRSGIPGTGVSLVVISVVAVVAVGCSSTADTAAPESTTAPESTSTSTTSTTPTTTTTALVEYLDQSALPPCGDAVGYFTRAELLPTYLPEGYELDAAWTGVASDEAISVANSDVAFRFAEMDGDVVTRSLTISRDAKLVQLAGGYSYTQVGDTVRGHPGAVWELTTRSGPGGWFAEWHEAGLDWMSSSGLPPEQFLAALGTFELGSGDIIDKSGRFVLSGVTGPHVPGVQRTQEFWVAGPARDAAAGAMSISIDEPIAGSWGTRPFGTRNELDGRVVFYDDGQAQSTLDDESIVTMRFGAVEPWRIDEIHQVLDGIERVGADDPRLAEVSLVRSAQLPMEITEGLPTYCLEE